MVCGQNTAIYIGRLRTQFCSACVCTDFVIMFLCICLTVALICFGDNAAVYLSCDFNLSFFISDKKDGLSCPFRGNGRAYGLEWFEKIVLMKNQEVL